MVIRYPAGRPQTRIAFGSLARLGTFTAGLVHPDRVVLVTDTNVARHHGARARASLRAAGLRPGIVVLRPGERTKCPETLARLWRTFASAGLGRDGAVVALGGGVVGDVAGMAAATWMRGVPWVCVPTSLLAQVDSAIGGKTGIDLPSGKNLAGAFHHPAGVLVDAGTLRTLPRRHLRAGLAEVIKTGMAVDAALFRWIERNVDPLRDARPAALAEAVDRALRAKARVVRRDPLERAAGVRTALNFGHTLGHALEAVRGYRGPLHGEAVAIGMRVAAALSVRAAGLDPDARARLEMLLDAFGLPRRIRGARAEALLEAMSRDKKRVRAGVRWVLTPRIGRASVPRLLSGRLVRTVLLEAGARS